MNDFATVDRLVNENLRLAHFFANKWSMSLGEDEAFSAAMGGLLRAAQKWDAAKGIPFGSFASGCIKHELCNKRHRQTAVKRGGRNTIVSLDAPIGEDGSASLGDLVADRSGEVEVQADERARLRQLLKSLSEREGYIITRRFGLDGDEVATLEEIGEELGITRERIRQVEAIAVEKLGKKHGVEPVSKGVGGRQSYGKLGQDNYGFDSEPSRPVVAKRRQWANAQQYLVQWRRANHAYLQFYRSLYRNRLRKWRLEWYRKNRARLTSKQRERYASDQAFAERAKTNAKRYRLRNPERCSAKNAAYREKHREELRKAQNGRTADLIPAYVRAQLSRRTGRHIDSFTLDEVIAHREHLKARRTELLFRPSCPKCGHPGRKDGHFRPSGRQRYSCKRCRMSYGLDCKTSFHRGKQRKTAAVAA